MCPSDPAAVGEADPARRGGGGRAERLDGSQAGPDQVLQFVVDADAVSQPAQRRHGHERIVAGDDVDTGVAQHRHRGEDVVQPPVGVPVETGAQRREPDPSRREPTRGSSANSAPVMPIIDASSTTRGTPKTPDLAIMSMISLVRARPRPHRAGSTVTAAAGVVDHDPTRRGA